MMDYKGILWEFKRKAKTMNSSKVDEDALRSDWECIGNDIKQILK